MSLQRQGVFIDSQRRGTAAWHTEMSWPAPRYVTHTALSADDIPFLRADAMRRAKQHTGYSTAPNGEFEPFHAWTTHGRGAGGHAKYGSNCHVHLLDSAIGARKALGYLKSEDGNAVVVSEDRDFITIKNIHNGYLFHIPVGQEDHIIARGQGLQHPGVRGMVAGRRNLAY